MHYFKMKFLLTLSLLAPSSEVGIVVELKYSSGKLVYTTSGLDK